MEYIPADSIKVNERKKKKVRKYIYCENSEDIGDKINKISSKNTNL